MPLESGSSQDTISHNVAELMDTGNYSQDQAIAIAEHEAGKDAAPLLEKAAVHYTDHSPNLKTVCAVCHHFIEGGTCALVQGAIDPHGWCEKFEAIATVKSDDTAIKTYFNSAMAVKAIGDGKIAGYLVAYGSERQRDSHQEFFRPNTDYALDYYPERPVLYHHGLTDIEGTKIGVIYKITPDANGLYAEAELYINHEDPTIRRYARKAYDMVLAGKLGWSSGSIPHLVEVTSDGEIKKWPIVEGSLTPTPAEPHRTSVAAIKSDLSALETEFPDEPKEPLAEEVIEAIPVESALPVLSKNKTKRRNPIMGKAALKSNAADIIAAGESASLSSDQILALLKALPDTAADEPDGDEGMMAEDTAPASSAPEQQPYMSKSKDQPAQMTQNQIKDAVEQYMKTAPAASRVPGVETDLPEIRGNSDIQVFSPYKDLSAEDMSYLMDMRSRLAQYTRSNYQPDVKFIRELTVKTQKAIAEGKIDFGKLEDGIQTTQRIAGIKTNELDNTGVAAAAGNWVPELWSNQLWKRIRLPNRVAGQFQVVEMPSPTYDLPVEDADPTVYFVPETTNDAQLSLASGAAIPDSLVSAGKVQLVAKKLALRVGFSVEMMEDSIIQFIPQLREQAMWAMENAIDYVLINGDTTNSSANINSAGSSVNATDKFMAFAGMRYLSLVTNAAANAIPVNAAGASPTLNMLRSARFTMQSTLNNYAIDPSRLFMVCDPYTYGRMLQIDELLAWYNNGRGSTVNDGVLPPNVDGVETFASQQLALESSTGKLDASGNTTGSIIIASKDAWKVGYRRNITASLDFLPYYDAYQLTMTIRLAFKNKDNYANAMIYNLATS